MSSIDSISQAMTRDMQHLATVSHNIANVNTPGYQQRVSFDQALAQDASYQETIKPAMDSGPIRASQRPLDLAIKTAGYFVLQYQNGVVLTRDGRFHINAEGLLAHASGALLLSNDGPIRVSGTDVRVEQDGAVRDNTGIVARIRLETAPALYPVAAGLYSAQATEPVAQIQLQPQALNASTVNPGTETVRMMELSRHLQSLQKAAQTYDQMLQNGINELGKSK